jgi:AcrR family transcriptional regulator
MTKPTTTAPTDATRRGRADAERSVAAILDAALDALSSDPDASMAEIARRAGVVRATIYVHFPTRETLIDAVTDRAFAEAAEAISAAEPERGDPAEAMERFLRATWQILDRFHALVAINTRLPKEELHRPTSTGARAARAANRARATRGCLPIRPTALLAPLDAPRDRSCRQRRTPRRPHLEGRRRARDGTHRHERARRPRRLTPPSHVC